MSFLKVLDINENYKFFLGVDWENLSNCEAPIIPKWKNEYDTSNFCGNKMYDEKEFVNPFFYKHQNTNQDVYYNFNTKFKV